MWRLTRRACLRPVSGAVFRSPASLYYNRAILSRTYANGHVRDATGAFSDKEKSQEDQYVKRHEQELVDRLKKMGFSNEQAQEIQKEVKSEQAAQVQEIRESKQVPVQRIDTDQFITTEEFIAFRKDVISKLRSIEDEILALKLQQSKSGKKNLW